MSSSAIPVGFFAIPSMVVTLHVIVGYWNLKCRDEYAASTAGRSERHP